MSNNLLQSTLNMARDAGNLAQRMRADPDALGVRIKGPMDLITQADHAVEEMLRQRIQAFDPNAAILGEEGGLKGNGPPTWIVDPIDGTVNYFRGSPHWAISIACYDGEDLTQGVIHAPDLGLTAWARRGEGSFLNGEEVIFGRTPTEAPLVVLGTSARASPQDYLNQIERLRASGIEHRRYVAATICFLGVLAGWVDAFQEPLLNIWDVAAGLVLIEEAGGVVRHDRLDAFLAGPSDVMARNRAHPEFDALLA